MKRLVIIDAPGNRTAALLALLAKTPSAPVVVDVLNVGSLDNTPNHIDPSKRGFQPR